MKKEHENKIGKALGFYIKYTRMNAAISIAKISKDLKVNPSTIVSIENGLHQASFGTIFAIITYFKMEPNLLFKQIEIELSDSSENK